GRPRVRGGLGQQPRGQDLTGQGGFWQTEGHQQEQRAGLGHFNVTRYAVRLWMSASRHCGSWSRCHCCGLVTTTLGVESCRAKLLYVPSGSRSATMKAER